jgi:hypothetical protein
MQQLFSWFDTMQCNAARGMHDKEHAARPPGFAAFDSTSDPPEFCVSAPVTGPHAARCSEPQTMSAQNITHDHTYLCRCAVWHDNQPYQQLRTSPLLALLCGSMTVAYVPVVVVQQEHPPRRHLDRARLRTTVPRLFFSPFFFSCRHVRYKP